MRVRLVHFTDPHLYADPARRKRGLCTRESFEATVAAARADHWPPDAVLVTGDIAEDESAGAYLGFREALGDVGAPILCLPGNHDNPVLMQALLNDAVYRYLGTHLVGGWVIVLLNSHVPGDVGGALGQAQLDALDRVLASHSGRPALICLHHPPVSMDSAWLDPIGLVDATALLAVVARHDQVRGMLWGHAHQAFDRRCKSVRLLCTPSTGRQFAQGADTFEVADSPPAYRRLDLCDDGSIESDVVWLDGDFVPQAES